MNRLVKTMALGGAFTASMMVSQVVAQRGGAPVNLPDRPTAVSIPAVSAEVTVPGKMFDSTTSLPPGRSIDHYKYEAREYFISGTANGKPYSTRIVVRKPAGNGRFSGLVLVERCIRVAPLTCSNSLPTT